MNIVNIKISHKQPQNDGAEYPEQCQTPKTKRFRIIKTYKNLIYHKSQSDLCIKQFFIRIIRRNFQVISNMSNHDFFGVFFVVPVFQCISIFLNKYTSIIGAFLRFFFIMKICRFITIFWLRQYRQIIYFGFQKFLIVDGFAIKFFFYSIVDFILNVIIFSNNS